MDNTNTPEDEIDWHSLSRARGWAMPSPRASAPWTEQEIEDVRAAQQRGESAEEIATAHGRSIGAIESQFNHMAMLAVSPNIKALHEAGLTISCAQALELLAQGIDDAAVTAQLELRPKSISNFLQRAAKRWGISGEDMRREVINKARVLLQLPPLPAPTPEVPKPRLAPAVLEVVELWRKGWTMGRIADWRGTTTGTISRQLETARSVLEAATFEDLRPKGVTTKPGALTKDRRPW